MRINKIKNIAGVSLVEVMVGLALGLITILAASSMILINQKHDRATISINDLNQDSAYVVTVVDQAIRNAGASVLPAWDLGALGCIPHLRRNGSSILPLSDKLPNPFDGFLGDETEYSHMSLAPILIGNNQSPNGSDILLITTGGSSGFGIQRNVSPGLYNVNAKDNNYTAVRVDNKMALLPNDLLLLSATDEENCIITQVAPNQPESNEALALAGTYFSETLNTNVTLDSITKHDTFLTSFGNSQDNVSNLFLMTVGADEVLYELDLVRKNGALLPFAVSENVVAMQAIYAVDENIDAGNTPNPTWQLPEGDYSIDSILTSEHKEKAKKLRGIVGVRMSLLFRDNIKNEEKITPDTLSMLNGLTGIDPIEIKISDENQYYQHKLLETTIPIKNALIKQPIGASQYE